MNVLAARDKLTRYRSAHPGKISQVVEAELVNEGAAIAAAGAIEYLESVFLGQRVLPFAIWDVADTFVISSGHGSATEGGSRSSANAGKRMVLDATALCALEVL